MHVINLALSVAYEYLGGGDGNGSNPENPKFSPVARVSRSAAQ
jgi:hypothetical protein